jgi:membrane protein YqaA with SNARE-associated domain
MTEDHPTAGKLPVSERIRRWAVVHADEKPTAWWLGALSFSESSFFPIPPDVMLVAILTASRRWAYYALITTAGSVAGGVAGYFIGLFFFDLIGTRIIDFYHLEEQMKTVGDLYAENAFWSIFTAAFTPIPYKVFTISAGFFKIDFLTFVIASVIGRGMRFFVVAYLMKLFGHFMGDLIYKYFNIFSTVVAVIVIGGVLLLYLL